MILTKQMLRRGDVKEKIMEKLIEVLNKRNLSFLVGTDDKILMEYDSEIDDEFDSEVDIYTYDTANYCEVCQGIRLHRFIYTFDNGEKICHDCINDDDDLIALVIEESVNNDKKAVSFLDGDTLEENGFSLYGNKEYEVSLHEIEQSFPDDLLKEAQKKNPVGTEFLFRITNSDCFTLGYEMWVKHKKEVEEVEEDEEDEENEKEAREKLQKTLDAWKV